MRHTILMASLSLALSVSVARADEASPIPHPEGEAAANQGTLLPWPPMMDLQAEARRRLLEPARVVRAPAAKPEVARLEADGTLSLKAQDIAVADLIEQIAALGDLQVLVADDVAGDVRLINLRAKAPEQALEAVAMAGKLDIQKRGVVFLVRKLRDDAPKPPTRPEPQLFSMTFSETSARRVAEMLSKQSGVAIEVEGAMGAEKIRLVRLVDVTLEAALENIALLLDAHVSWKDGRYILSAKPK